MKIKINKLVQILDKLPGSIYWKDKDGVYLGRNQLSLLKCQAFGFEDSYSTKDYIVGKTDFNYLSKRDAELFRENDLLVIETKSEIIQNESVLLPNNVTLTQISCKKPLYDKNNHIIGIIGNTIDVTNISLLQRKNNISASLTKRQHDCLFYLVKGMTKKQIGQKMQLSYRTIECHFDAIKHKLKCHSRTDLIKKALEINSIRIKLTS